MKISRRKNLKKGFTLAEMLVVVAIIGILLAVAIPNVISYYRTLKLTELDDSARTIFLAAQNELTALKNKGDAKLQTLATHIDGITTTPALSNGVYSTTPQHVVYVDSSPYTYATDEDIRDTAGTGSYNDNVLVLGSIETEIQGNHYVIEYNPKYGTVYAVWYWEKGSFDYENDAYKSSGIEKPEEKNSRLPKMVGYYGGSAIDRIDVGQMPFPTLDLINAEELRLVIGVPTGTGLSAALTANNVKIDIDINGVPITEVSDFRLEPGNTATIVLDTLNTASYTVGPNTRPTATGDSFTYGMQYKEWLNSCTGLPAPGEDLTITVALSDRNGKLLTQTSTVVVNSLFADVAENAAAPDTYTAQIAYGRHLQNLDEDTSGVTSSITAARQIGNIDFKDGHTAPPLDLESWDATYTDEITRESGYTAKPFNAINNTHLTSFDGNNLTIRNLNVKETGTDVNAGLFGSFGDSTGNYYIDRVTLINAKVSGESSVGALAGEATNTDVTGCKVYIDDNIAYTGTGSAPTAYLTSIGGAVGGLIGSTGGTVKIENSFASTVEHSDSDPVGGLVGRAGGTSVQISGSYAAGYLDGAGTVGGLIGSLTAGTANIGDSYAAGIITGATTSSVGGLIGDIGSNTVNAENAYAAVRYYSLTGTPTVYGAYDGADTTGTNVNYVGQSTVTYEPDSGHKLGTSDLTAMIGTSFGTAGAWNTGAGATNSLDNTHAYKLIDETKSLGTTNPYPYPMLMSAGATVVPQYGDWLEDDDEGPMMAYIEQYGPNDFGVYALEKADASGDPAVRVNTLKHNVPVVDDFYRVISTGTLTGGTFTLDGDLASHTLQSDPNHSTIDSGSKTYNVYTLDDATGWNSETNYYHEIVLSSGETYTYLYNPSFACEAFDVTEWAAVPTPTIDTTTKLTKPSAQGSGTTLQYTGVVIRSARQLANVAAYTTGADAPGPAGGDAYGLSWTYHQVENVDFSTYTGSGLTVGKSTTPALTPAKLTTGTYDGNTHTVSNLYIAPAATGATGAGLFESVGNGGEIVDLKLVNVSVAGGDAVATGGLVGKLDSGSKVDNCGIYVSAPDYYDGFTVTGSGTNGVGGLIGQINGGTVTASFAAVNVVGGAYAVVPPATPVNPVGGFAGQFISGTVENCYAGGFVDKDSKTYENDSVNVTGNNNVGGFVGSVAAGSNVFFRGVNYSTASVGSGTSLGLFAGASGYELPTTGDIPILYAVAKAFDASGNITAPREESAYLNDPDAATEKVTTTESYNQENVFPYGSGLDTHHGDWILVEVCGLYYDTANGTTGYYSNGNAVDGYPLFTDKPVNGDVATDDGYIFLSKDDLGDVYIMVAGTSYELVQETLSAPITINGVDYEFQYTVPNGALNAVTDNYYTAVSINGRVFSANFGLACEIYKGRADNMNEPQKKSGLAYKDSTGADKTLNNFNGAVVRTARQLANLGIRSNAGEYDSTNRKVYTNAAKALQEADYVQLLDIDYGKYKATGTPGADKFPEAQVLTGSSADFNHTPITLSTGGYDGNGYEIRNLVPGMIRQVTSTDSSNAVTEALVESGLFGRVTGGKLENITLINATVENDAGSVTGGGTGFTDVEHKLTGTNWLSGTGVSAPAAGRDTGSSLPGKTTTYTHDGFTFTVVWNADKSGKVYHLSSSVSFDGLNTSYKAYFGGGVSSDGEYVTFTTTSNATVRVWWQSGGASRSVGIFNAPSTDSAYQVAVSDSKNKDENNFFEYDVGAGTYYIGSTGSGNNIYQIEIIEHKPAVITGGTDPDGSIFPDILANAYKVRFGALVGAVNPSDSADGTVTIENCGVYVEPEGLPATAITSWTLAEKQDVETKYNECYKNYAVSNSATSINEDTVGGLIGMATEGTTIVDSFATVKVTGVKFVGGFAGVLRSVIVEDCYSGGHTENGIYSSTDYNVTANGVDSFAGGFVGQMQVESSNKLIFTGVDYSTASAKGNNVGAFSGGTTLTGVTKWNGYDDVTEFYAIGLVDGNKQNDESYLDDTMTIRPYTSNGTATPYDVVLLEDIYPYMTVDDGKGEHHGDWSIRFNFVYYELYKEQGSNVTVNGKTLDNQVFSIGTTLDPDANWIGFYAPYAADDGYGGIKTKVINTLRVDGDVYDSGYMIVGNANVTKFPITILSRYLSSKEVNWVEKGIRDPEKAEDPGKDATGESYNRDNPPPKYINVDAERIFDFESLGNDVADEIADAVGQYGYAIPLQGQDVAASNDFYLRVYVNGQLYLYNPQFPCEVVNSGMAVQDSSGKWSVDTKSIRPKEDIDYIIKDENGSDKELVLDDTVNGILIRSPWNLAGMARYSRPASTGQVSRDIVAKTFYQIMEVDYEKYNQNKISDANSSNRFFEGKDRINKAGTSWVFGQVPAVLTGGTYEGNNHTIRNLYLSNDSSKNNMSGLFGTVTDGTIRNLKLEHIHVNSKTIAQEDKPGGGKTDWTMDIGALAAVVEGNSTISNVHLSDIEIFLHKVPKAEEDGTNLIYNWSENASNDDKDVAVVNSVGGVIGSLKGGTVKDVTVDGISIDLTNGVKYTISSDKKKLTIDTSTGVEKGSSMDKNSTPSVGGAIGKIDCSGSGASVSVSNLTVTDPTINANRGKNDTVGGVIGSADGTYSTYSANATEVTRPVTITDTGVYISDGKKSSFETTMGVISSVSDDAAGGFAGYLGKGVNVTGDYAAIRVQGETYAGGFAGQIEGSHVESCYSGGYLNPATHQYSTTDYNVTAEKTAGGFAGKIEVEFASGSSTSMAMYMTGYNYSTSSVRATGSSATAGRFAGDADDVAAAALAKKMGGLNNYACGTVAVGSGGTVNTESTVKTGSAIPRQVHSAADFETAPYDDTLVGPFPFATGKDQKAHHGDWLETELMAAGYWEVEDGKLRLWYIPADDTDNPVEVLEPDAEGFDHDSRDAKRITDAGYFVVSSDTTATLPTGTGLTSVTTDIEEKVKNLLGGTAVKAEVYGTNNGYSDVQTWTITGGAGSSATFYVNPAYAKAVGTTSGTLGTETNPYEIRTVKQLDNMDGTSASSLNTGWFKQTHDIVFDTSDSYTSIENFAGHFNGGFFRILDATAPLFDELKGNSGDVPTLYNIILYSPTGNGKFTTDSGGLANSSSGDDVKISNSIVAGYEISGTNVGGLVGEVKGGKLEIVNSEATNKLSGTNVGGLVGSVSSGTLTIEKSYAGGSITGGTSVGGLVGSGTGANVTYKDVYSYVDMRSATSATDVYGIGPGSVDAASLHKYWSTGLPSGKTARDSAPIEGVALAEIKKNCQDLFAMSAEEYMKPDASDRDKGLENLAEGVADDADKFALFPFAAFVTDGAGRNYHYGEWPKTEYLGAFYHEVENGGYHIYAYGGEIYDGKVYQMKLLDTLCYDHHLNGERESISDSGYGVFYPSGWSVTGPTLGADITGDIRNELVKDFGLDTSTEVKSFTEANDVRVTLRSGSNTVSAEVNTAFAAAIAEQLGGAGSSMGYKDSADPIQVRTYSQLQNLAKGVDTSYGKFAITHDIDAAASRKTDKYTPGALKVDLNGNGYRIIDLNIEADGNAGLFTNFGSAVKIQGVILYASDNNGHITAESGNAGGILAEMRQNGSSIENCIVSGYTIKGTGYVGGIIGEVTSSGTSITNCQAINTLEGSGSNVTGIGGIAGRAYGGIITNCYAGGEIKNASAGTPVGGIYGRESGSPTVTNCYSYMDLTNTDSSNVYPIGESYSGADSYYFSEYVPAGVTSQGSALSYDDMCGKRGDDSADYVYASEGGTSDTAGLENWGEKMYPFPAVVKVHLTAGVDAGVTETGDYPVHYGDWPYNARAAGIAYWEKYEDNTYGVQIVGVKANGSQLYKSGTTTDEIIDTLCHDRHVDSTGKITEHKIVASGLASFSTYSKLTVDATFSGASSTEQAGVKAAINKAVGGRCVTCTVTDTATSGGTTTFTKAKVKLDTTDINIPLYYNGLFAEVGYEDFGTEANPISIRTVRQLDNIPDTNTATKNFEQNHDLYGEGYPNSYTGATGFKGTYDGQSFKILELSIGPNRSGSDSDAKNSAGLFTSAGGSNCEIKNVIMYSPHGSATISGGSGQGTSNTTYHGVGGIIGRLSDGNAGTKITNCVVAGYTISGADHVGGIVGYAYQGGTITNCASVNTIKGEVDSVNAKGVGGIAGGGDNYGTSYALNINNCYAGGTISDCGNSTVVGGVYGHNSNTGSNLTVKNCYVYVNMSGCGTASVYTISGDTKGNISENNYYLAGTTSLYPSSCTYQGASKTASDLAATNASTLFPTDSDAFDTADYTYVPGSSGGLTPATPGYEFPAVVTMGDGAGKKRVHFGALPN